MEMQLPPQWINTNVSDFASWLCTMIQQLCQEQVELGFITIWAIWNTRNNEVINKKQRGGHNTALFIKTSLNEVNQCLRAPSREPITAIRRIGKYPQMAL